MKHLIVIVIAHACLSFGIVSAQEDYYEKIFTTENGLPHDNILTLTGDKTGFLWIGTWDGLSRYDGYEFRNYFHDPLDSTSIPFFTVRTLCVDRHNNLWVFPLANLLAKYNRSSDNFIIYSSSTDSVLKRTGINNIATDFEGNLILTGNSGVAVYDSITDEFCEIRITDEQNRPVGIQEANYISFDNSGNIWITTMTNHLKGIFSYREKTIIITEEYQLVPDDLIFRPNGYLMHFEFAKDSAIGQLNFSNNGLFKFPENNDYYGPVRVNTGKKSYYWYCRDNAVHIITGHGSMSVPLKPDESVQTLYIDPSGTIWYCTLMSSGMGTGLHRYNRTPGYFTHYLPDVKGVPTVVYSIQKDDKGNLLVGTEGNNFIACIRNDGSMERLNILGRKDEMSSQHIRAMIPYADGLLIGYMKERLDYFDFRTRKFKNIRITNDPSGLKEPYGFRNLLKAPDESLLIGSIGLFRYIPENRTMEMIWQNDTPGKTIYCLKADPRGTIWAGLGRILFRLSPDYKLDTMFRTSEAEYNIEDISFDEDGKMWLALLGGGLEHFDPATGHREFYTTADGLSNNTTYSILKDRHDNLWITTNNGISRFSPKTGKFRIFGQTDGLRIHEFNSDAAYLDEDGQMFFGGMGGVVSFHPDSITDIDQDPGNPLIITEFRVSGVPRHFRKAVYESRNVMLSKGDDNFGVTFACLNFKHPEKIKYRYRILGLSDEWTEGDYLHRSINIAGLKPDSYTLEIQSSDIFGEWKKSLVLNINIPPQFYETVWFTFLMVICGLFTIGLFFVLNNRQIRIKENQKQQYLKLESIRGQLNPHFIFNSLNSINYFIAKSDRLSANRYIANFSKLIRAFLSNMSQDYVPLSEEIESLEDYLRLEYLRFGDRFNYSLTFNHIVEIEKWEVFPGMVQPFIENAIWHGVRGLRDRKGNIKIDFTEDQSGFIRCTVVDDGVGRTVSARNNHHNAKRKSRGIALITERMQLINHLESKQHQVRIEDLFTNQEECGTLVNIDIPSRNRYK